MKREIQRKIKISVSLDREIVTILNERTSNRSNYIDWVLLQHFSKIGEDISKIKL